MKEFIVVGGIVVAGVVIYALIKYKNKLQDEDIKVERMYIDDLNVIEIKKWFKEKMISNNCQGVLLYPTSNNIEKWNIKLDEKNENMIIQVVYDKSKDIVLDYREVFFENLSENLKKLLDDNNGCIVIEI